MHWKYPCRGHFELYMQGTRNAPVGGISSYTCKALEMPLTRAFQAIHVRHWKCPCKGHFQLYMQGTRNALVREIFSYTCNALEIAL
jgi:hypothetical protein